MKYEPTPAQALDYIVMMARQLEAMAQAAGLTDLAEILSRAEKEARSTRKATVGLPGAETPRVRRRGRALARGTRLRR
jgi:benzoyl-CoA reductase/2-hydroxyglutaryl-CoA dehydratase subunit BcrC/BadD/HgdB